ncbi:A disintegrin and metalloproteinase with thrombospondin motifs 14 [Mactra antiquata]
MDLTGFGCFKLGFLLVLCFTGFTSGHDESLDKRFLLSDYHWGAWSRLLTCSSSDCQKGSIERQRHCISEKSNIVVSNSNCMGASSDLKICHPSECGNITTHAVDGQWGSWSNFSSCSHTCGKGLKSRSRLCNNPPPSGGGDSCPGSSRQFYVCQHSNDCSVTACHDTNQNCIPTYCTGNYLSYGRHNCQKTCGYCNTNTGVTTTHASVVNGHWGAWGSFSHCSASCGYGIMTRHRYCNNPAPSGGGHTCTGSSIQSFQCHHTCTPSWSSWSHWTSCSVSCNMGTITRHRTCNQHGSTDSCHGNKTETHECSTGPCAEWSHWFEGDCSVSCGNGTMERLRHCSTGRPTDCQGKDYEIVPCTNILCI